MLEIVTVRLPISRRMHMKPQAQKRCHGDDRNTSRQLSWKGGDDVSVKTVKDVDENNVAIEIDGMKTRRLMQSSHMDEACVEVLVSETRMK